MKISSGSDDEFVRTGRKCYKISNANGSGAKIPHLCTDLGRCHVNQANESLSWANTLTVYNTVTVIIPVFCAAHDDAGKSRNKYRLQSVGSRAAPP